MNNKDSASKRSVTSPKVMSLRESMGMSKPDGYGDVTPVKQVQRNIKSGNDKRRGKGASLATKHGYDTNTRVGFGAKDKPRKSNMPKKMEKKK